MAASPMRYFFLCSLFCSLMACSASAENKALNLEQYQWKKRIILSYPSTPEAGEAQLKKMTLLQAEIADRDLLILKLDAPLESHTPEQIQAIIKKHDLVKGTHILIGKDGRVKDRQNGELDWEKWFKLIDTMPMRKNEMKR